MRKIRLSDTDLELFDIEISPSDFTFYQRNKDAFKTMWREQGKPFWTRFAITFRSFTVKHGVIKQMNIDSPKFQNLIDQAFIFIHDQFVDGKQNMAKNFIEDVARLAQSQDKLPALDSKSFARDPFYARETRELFRKFFGMPDQKSSYLKVYILCPVYLRFGGSACRCLVRWVDAPLIDNPKDDSYWTPPTPHVPEKSNKDSSESITCSNCIDDCGTKYFREKIMGGPGGPKFVDYWTLGDPRFADNENPLFAPHCNPDDDWRDCLSVEMFREFLQYAKFKYGKDSDKCSECVSMKKNRDKIIHVCRASKKKKKKKSKEQEELIKDLKEVRDKIDELEDECLKEGYEERIREIIKDKPKVKEALEEAERQEKLDKLKEEEEKKAEKKASKKNKKDAKKTLNAEKSAETKNDTTNKQDCNVKKPVFDTKAKVSNEFEYSLLSRNDITANKSVVAGFKVIKIVDEKNGLFEVNVSVANLKSDEEESSHNNRMKEHMKRQDLNAFILTADILRAKIDGLPKKMEWWEGRGLAVAVLNYEEEEKEHCKKWTNFALRISGFEEVPIKQTMIKLLFYVAKRKKRTCYGWNMEVDDVVACILPEDSPNIDDLSISIQRGFRFEDRLSDEEKDSLLKHQPNLRLDKVLMGMEAGDATKLLDEKGGKEKLIKIFSVIAEKDIYGTDLPTVDIEKLRKKLNNKEDITQEDILWEQMIRDSAKFEFFVLMDKDKESDMWDIGMKSMDIRYYLANKNPKIRICPVCKIVGQECKCESPVEVGPHVHGFIERSDFTQVKVLGEDNEDMPKMLYKELNSFPVDEKEKDNKRHCKAVAKKNKDKKIELNDLPAKFLEAGIKSEKTTISIPANQNISLMGNVPVNMSDKLDRMAPIPGMTSSLNFTFQNGKKEQTITVSLGAYMPEDKIHKMEEKKDIIKLITEEDKRQCKINAKREKKLEKKKRMEKGKAKSKSPQKSPQPKTTTCTKPKEEEAEQVSKKEKNAELTGMFLREILGQPEAIDVSKQINTQMGLSNRKPLPWVKVKDKDLDTDRKTVSPEPSANSDLVEDMKTSDDSEKETAVLTDSMEAVNLNSNNNHEDDNISVLIQTEFKLTNKMLEELESTIKMETDFKQSGETPNDSESLNKVQEDTNQVSADPKPGNDSQTDLEQAVETPPDSESKTEVEFKPICDEEATVIDGNLPDEIRNRESPSKDNLKKCWSCGTEEPARKTFKKCQKCKEEGILEPRYYCGRDCQVEDWRNRHKVEHRDGLIH